MIPLLTDRTNQEIAGEVSRLEYTMSASTEFSPETITPWTLLESSTARQEDPRALDRQIMALFARANGTYFEDGMESEFSRELVAFIETNGDMAMEEVAHIIVNTNVNPEVASEALRWLGYMGSGSSYEFRLWLLEQSLFSPSAIIRDGAILGLASLDTPHAIPYLKQAIKSEQIHELRMDMEQVRGQLLETTASASPSATNKKK